MKRILLVDAVEHSPERVAHPMGSVEQWFGKYLNSEGDVRFQVIPSSAPTLTSESTLANGVIISGSPRDAWSNEPGVMQLIEFAQSVVSRGQPILGVCFGHQLLGRALGADVQRNPAGWEVGTCKVQLTQAGLKSPLFKGFAAEFDVIESHRDAVLTLPAGGMLLASNAHTPVQAFSIEERTFGVQFHPEMDGAILRHVWTERREKLRGTVSFDLDQALDSASADASRVLLNFVATLA